MRDCDGLVDSFVWIIRAPLGKNDVDNKVGCHLQAPIGRIALRDAVYTTGYHPCDNP